MSSTVKFLPNIVRIFELTINLFVDLAVFKTEIIAVVDGIGYLLLVNVLFQENSGTNTDRNQK
jgi:hypothetical protein